MLVFLDIIDVFSYIRSFVGFLDEFIDFDRMSEDFDRIFEDGKTKITIW
jgi:hypothetical protein